MNILSIQWSPIWQDNQANLRLLQENFEANLNSSLQTSPKKTSLKIDLVILPELFHGGFSMQPERFAESIDGEVSQILAGLAIKYSVAIVAGVAQKQVRTTCHGQETKFYNRALVFDSNGQQIGAYTKQKLFSYAHEQQTYSEGHQPVIVDIKGQPFAVLICYDLRFPELFRQVAKQVKGIIVIANWPASRQTHWEALLKARAIENQCFMVGVNRIGQDGNGLDYIGGSMVVSPLGEVIAYGGEMDKTMTASIDISQTNLVRQQFPFLDDMTIE
ncbi:nitrilase-related carbon-nitrogen hydrolase [Thiomicrorhabdus sp.]|uniref:nitrilase-related carbon-nitrogen hydrolase n=1 Tax=Thiomicrorhabdus sp. TaxID=2039724 RepID=UPI002AA90F64|nr:nitrilase-related carbon-nitrogen hydrolase [Thiomicrorhabdus sp.]